MKKNFLFLAMAVFLAGFGFGGISMAEDITTLDGLIAAINAEGTEAIDLGNLEINHDTTRDLKGKTLNLNGVLSVVTNGKITVSNGKINSNVTDVLTVNGGELVLGENLEVNTSSSLFWILGNGKAVVNGAKIKNTGTQYTPIYVEKGTFTLEKGDIETAVMSISVKEGEIIINGGKVESTAGSTIGLNNNLANSELQTKISIHGGEIIGNDSLATVYGFKNTTINFDGGKVVAKNRDGIQASYGCQVTIDGDAEVEAKSWAVFAGYNSDDGSKITINSGTFDGYIGARATVEINGGTFNKGVQTPIQGQGKIDIKGGTFASIPTGTYTVPEGKMLALNNEDKYVLVDAVTVTLVNGNETQGTITMPKNDTLTQEGIGTTLTAEGKVFMGWYNADGTKFPETETTVSENITLTAKWGHTVKFLKESEDTSAIKELIVEENTSIKVEDIPEDPTKEGYKFKEWTVGGASANVSTYNIDVDVTFVASWTELISASTSSIKAASVPNDEGREKRNLDKFTVSNSYDATTKTVTVTITDNGMEAYVGGNSQTAKKWLGLIADFGVIVNGSDTTEGIEKYTIGSNNELENNIDRTDANIYGGEENSNTDFIIWITREDKDGKTIRFVNSAAEDDYVNVKFVFKDKQSSSSSSTSGGGGGGGSSSSYSCKSLPSNAVANNSKKPSSNTNYFYDTDTTKVCSFVCKEGYEWNKTSSKCEVAKTTTTGDNTKVDETKVDENNENTGTDIGGTTSNEFSQEFNDAYNWAFKNGITTMDSIEKADMYGPLTRIAMAKMLSQYAINVLGKTPDTTKVVPTFPDVDEQLNKDYNDGVTLAYQLGIMGINIDNFRPYDLVTRAEFGTALSRMLYGLADGEGDQWYKTHLDKLMNEAIITVDTPDLQELRGYVMIMLMRSAQ